MPKIWQNINKYDKSWAWRRNRNKELIEKQWKFFWDRVDWIYTNKQFVSETKATSYRYLNVALSGSEKIQWIRLKSRAQRNDGKYSSFMRKMLIEITHEQKRR